MKKYSEETIVSVYSQHNLAHKASIRKFFQAIHPEYHDEIQKAWEEAKRKHRNKMQREKKKTRTIFKN